MYKVMIVEDEVLVRVGLKTTIDWEAMGFTIIAEASNGEQGYELYLKHRPEVVITDIKMPKQDGLWLVEQIRKQDTETRILMLTCYDEFSYARKALKVGADDYILKSEVEDEELIKLMDTVKTRLDMQNRARAAKDRSLADPESLKHSLMSDLMNNSFDINERLLKSLQELNFLTDSSSYAFMKITTLHNSDQPMDKRQTEDAVMNILYEQMNQYDISYMTGHQNNRHLLFLASAKLNKSEMKRILAAAAGGAKQYFDISVHAVYSGVFTQIAMAGGIYKDFTLKAELLFYPLQTSGTIRPADNISFTEPNVFDLKRSYNTGMIEAIGHEDFEHAEELLKETGHYFEQNLVSPKTVKIFYSNLMGDIFNNYGFFLAGREEFETHETYHYRIIHSEGLSDILELMTAFSKALISVIKGMRYNNSRFLINHTLNYLENHYTENISLEDAAKEMNISKHYLCSIFKKETGENMSLYINKLRIEKAKQLLLESDSRIKEVFEKVGYSNQQYFSKIFKKITGMTVNEYKESLIKK